MAAVIHAGLRVSAGTWPMRTQNSAGRMVGQEPPTPLHPASFWSAVTRPAEASPIATRPRVPRRLEEPSCRWRCGNYRQATSPRWTWPRPPSGRAWRCSRATRRVLNADGTALTVREALALINRTLDEVLAEQEGEFDADTRWALAWFEQAGFAAGEFGAAETLSTGQEHQRRGHGGRGHPPRRRGQGAANSTRRATRRLGPGSASGA